MIKQEWNRTDPRHEDPCPKRIIITDGRTACAATTHMDHGFDVEPDTIISGYGWVGEHDEWPKGWCWLPFPKEEKSGESK